jgi:hypothetical protein
MFDRLFVILHHAEAIDPDLVDWIQHRIDAITGLEPSALVIGFTILIVAFPIFVGALFLIRRRAMRHDGPVGDRPEGPDEI